jgi:undecaprenyl diphosphate synthase
MANTSKINSPKNVGIIMDGNGRWAIKNSLKISEGHKKGVSIVKDIVEESVKQDLSSLTIYAFSSENWKRPKTEVTAIKKLVVDAINDQVSDLKEQKVRLKFFGHIYDFGKKVIDKISYAEEETYIQNSKLDLNVALGYGGKQDIVDMAKKISSSVLAKQITLKDINEKTLHNASSVPVDEIDLLIRTGGDRRISNFLLYQIAYAEIMFIEKYWPDFNRKDFIKCLRDFKKIKRRFGKRKVN